MNLEEEIAITQFGQGVHSDEDLRNHFAQLDESGKERRLWEFTFFLYQTKPVDADIDQAIAASSLQETDAPCVMLRKHRLPNGLSPLVNLPENEREKTYRLMLYLFKTAYQRHYALEKGSLTNWWYWDLSKSEIVHDIRTAHQSFVEAVYANPGFRSELVSIAKLQYADKVLTQSRFHETEPEQQTHFNFLNYDEMITHWIHQQEENQKYSRPLSLLFNSLSKALSIRYGLAPPQVKRVLREVVERHRKEMYDTGPVDD